MITVSAEIHNDHYTCRPARQEDLPGVHALLAAVAVAEPEGHVPTLEDVQRDFTDPWYDPATDTRVALAPDGTLAAYFRVLANPEPTGEARAYMDNDVHPAHRNHGLEEPLLDWIEVRGTERLRAIAAANPGRRTQVLRLGCRDTDHDQMARYERRGFRPIRYSYRMRRDLRQPIPARPLPAGLALRTYQPELDEQLRQAFNESFSDNWSSDPFSANDWQQFMVQRSTFRSDLSFAILDGTEIAAFSMNRVEPTVDRGVSLNLGWISSLGTRRAWRQRGLASALLVESLRAFRADGLDYAGLGVDADNPTGAVGLYEHLGFVPYVRSIAFHKIIGG